MKSEGSQSCLTLSAPMDCGRPGSSVHGIFQARVLEWGAIAFSGLKILLWLKKETNQQMVFTHTHTHTHTHTYPALI